MPRGPEATVASIVVSGDGQKVLLTRRGVDPFKGRWCLPGGHIKPYETAREAVFREVKEETGLDFRGDFFDVFDEIIPNHGIHAVVLVYSGSGIGTPTAQPPEVSEFAWISWEEAIFMSLGFNHDDILTGYRTQKRNLAKEEPGQGVLAECAALRNEILKRIEMRQQVLVFTLAVASAVITWGTQLKMRIPLLLYPILAAFLALLWMQSDVRVGEMGDYIRNRVAPRFRDLGDWETYIRQKNSERRFRPLEISASGLFSATGIVSVFLAFFAMPDAPAISPVVAWVLSVLDLFAVGYTLRVVWTRSSRYDRSPNRLLRELLRPPNLVLRILRYPRELLGRARERLRSSSDSSAKEKGRSASA